MLPARWSWTPILAGVPAPGRQRRRRRGKVKAVRISEVPLVMSGHQVIEFPGGDKGLVPSPDRRHVAYVFRHEDGRQAVAVDGRPWPALRLDPW